MRKSLTRKQVVTKRLEIDAIFRNGKKYSAKQVKLLVADNNLEINRIIVIPVKNYGNSVERNRIKRQIKEIWRVENPNFKSGLDFAFVVYPGKTLDYWTQKGNLTTLFEKANLYKI